eukprot:TRINITY_DN552_c0_g1_i11.p1 TRINITY_DN552_c0_g1~~TRINITY_DN552_c0_g1_i11.p1  ORF type:complete len:518 (+),score=121.95 TRINITY_DN552_c0_g1_i11:761-2314(+)
MMMMMMHYHLSPSTSARPLLSEVQDFNSEMGIDRTRRSSRNSTSPSAAKIAVSSNFSSIAFADEDGVCIYDVSSGRCLASSLLPYDVNMMGEHQGTGHSSFPNAIALEHASGGSLLAAGLNDGQLGLLNYASGNPHNETEGVLRWRFHHIGYPVDLTAVSFGMPSNFPGSSHECSLSYPSTSLQQLMVGTSGGHVVLLDALTGQHTTEYVGSCSCPVNCLGVAAAAAGSGGGMDASLVYAAYQHDALGNGHYDGVYVWDVRTAVRVALLIPGSASSRRRSSRGRERRPCGQPVKAVHADAYKMTIIAGKTVSVIDARTWKPLYDFSICHEEEEVRARQIGTLKERKESGAYKLVAQQAVAAPMQVKADDLRRIRKGAAPTKETVASNFKFSEDLYESDGASGSCSRRNSSDEEADKRGFSSDGEVNPPSSLSLSSSSHASGGGAPMRHVAEPAAAFGAVHFAGGSLALALEGGKDVVLAKFYTGSNNTLPNLALNAIAVQRVETRPAYFRVTSHTPK